MLNEKEVKKYRKILSEDDKSIAEAFKVLSDVNRFRIFRILSQNSTISVSDISKILNISLPLASQHTKIMHHANIIQKKRIGKKIVPALKQNNPFVQAAVKTIDLTLKLKP